VAIALSIFFAILATCTNFLGLLVWPALILTALFSKRGWGLKVSIVLIALLSIFIYTNGMSKTDIILEYIFNQYTKGQEVELLKNIFLLIKHCFLFAGRFIASPFSREYPVLGCVLAYIALAYVMFHCYQSFRWKQQEIEVKLFSVMCLIIYVAALAAGYGRIFGSATEERYQTTVLFFWLCFCCLFYLKTVVHNRLVAQISVCLIIVCLLAPAQLTSLQNNIRLSYNVKFSHLAASLGVTDMDIVKKTLNVYMIKHNRNLVNGHDKFLKENNLGYFQHDYQEAVGKKIGPIPMCYKRKVTPRIKVNEDYVTIESNSKLNAEMLYVLDMNGEVVGLGLMKYRTFFDSESKQWRAIVNLKTNGVKRNQMSELRVIADTGNRYCQLI